MTVPLPQPLPTSSGWQVVDKLDRVYAARPAAGGLATLDVGQLDGSTRWVLTHAVASCTSSTATVMRLYFGSTTPAGFRDGTDAGNFNVADWTPGLFVPEGTDLIAQWSACSDGALATLALQADVYRRAS